MAMAEEGAQLERAAMAIMSPVSIRAAFIATFMNRYAALPMALTGVGGACQAAVFASGSERQETPCT